MSLADARPDVSCIASGKQIARLNLSIKCLEDDLEEKKTELHSLKATLSSALASIWALRNDCSSGRCLTVSSFVRAIGLCTFSLFPWSAPLWIALCFAALCVAALLQLAIDQFLSGQLHPQNVFSLASAWRHY